KMIDSLNRIAVNRGQSLAQMALAWVLREGGVSSVLVGVSKVSQLEDNVRCINNTSFTEEELKKIDSIVFQD
ncbi:MAG: L-glyceraldehyde 3-phosphate reductase, partial [Clostridiaceae bacterium]|nr:L-glyceraldehyde 3-phosphate reductase [Clostridiaceae bacterium]